MYKLFSKYGLILAFVIGLLFILIFLIPVLTGLPAGFMEMGNDDQVKTTVFDVGLKATGGLLIATVIITILASLYSLAKNPKGAIKGIIGIAVLLVVVFVLYSTSTAEAGGRVQAAMHEFNVSDTMGKWISAFMKTSFVLAAAAVIVVVLGEITNLFK